MNISFDIVKLLRDQTGAGGMDCKKALEDAGGDTRKAVALLLEKGVALAAKKSDRETGQVLIQSYIHQGGKVDINSLDESSSNFSSGRLESFLFVRRILSQ